MVDLQLGKCVVDHSEDDRLAFKPSRYGWEVRLHLEVPP